MVHYSMLYINVVRYNIIRAIILKWIIQKYFTSTTIRYDIQTELSEFKCMTLLDVQDLNRRYDKSQSMPFWHNYSFTTIHNHEVVILRLLTKINWDDIKQSPTIQFISYEYGGRCIKINFQCVLSSIRTDQVVYPEYVNE